tara:strand:+ start:241 stop:408 length:168 start_codon:yes stop_codon:yes gene_type:complete
MARIKNFLTPQWLKEFEVLKLQAASRKRVRPRKLQAASLKPQAKPEPSSGSLNNQ